MTIMTLVAAVTLQYSIMGAGEIGIRNNFDSNLNAKYRDSVTSG
jgi:hypothetical protein